MSKNGFAASVAIVLGLGVAWAVPASAVPMGLNDGDNTNEVLVDGKIWFQLTDTVGLTWNQVRSVCNTDGSPNSGVLCTGALDSNGDGDLDTDLTGRFWATLAEVGSLLDAITAPIAEGGYNDDVDRSSFGARENHPGTYWQQGSLWAPASLTNDFAPTFEFVDPSYYDYRIAAGFVATEFDVDFAYVPIIYDDESGASPQFQRDFANTNGYDSKSYSGEYGHWMYRKPSAVPEPPASLLLLVSLIGFIRFRRASGR